MRLPRDAATTQQSRRATGGFFVHGCFWHRYPGCECATTPASNMAYWNGKFARNVERDAANRAALECAGWRVLVVWECELKDMAALRSRLFAHLHPPAVRKAAAGLDAWGR